MCRWSHHTRRLLQVMSQSHHTPGPRTGCPRAVLNKNRTSIHGARTGPERRRTNFASPYVARRILMYALQAYGPRTGFEILNSPWKARAGTVRGPYGPRTAKYDARAGFLSILVVSIPLRVRKGAVRHPCGSRTGPVGYEKHWRFPCGTRTVPVRASDGAPVESCESFDQTISVQPCQAVRGRSLMWPREQHRR